MIVRFSNGGQAMLKKFFPLRVENTIISITKQGHNILQFQCSIVSIHQRTRIFLRSKTMECVDGILTTHMKINGWTSNNFVVHFAVFKSDCVLPRLALPSLSQRNHLDGFPDTNLFISLRMWKSSTTLKAIRWRNRPWIPS